MQKSASRYFIIDDDADDIEIFREAIAAIDNSIECDYAGNGREGLKALDEKKIIDPDMIFLDVNMPQMDGWECLNALKNKDAYKTIPVIMYSTSSHQKLLKQALDSGAICFFTKPNSYSRLKDILRIIVKHHDQNSLADICPEILDLTN